MKNLLTLAIILSSSAAFATRARVLALGNSPHLIDVAVSSPDQLSVLGDSLTIESGTTAAATTGAALTTPFFAGNAEGSIYKTFGEGKIGLALGHQDSMVYNNRNVIGSPAGAIDLQQNPLELNYSMKMADLAVGAGIFYSNYDNKAAVSVLNPGGMEKENSMGVRLGVSSSIFYGNIKFLVADKYENAAGDYKGKMGIDLKGGINLGDLSLHGQVMTSGYKITTAGVDASDFESMMISVKAIDTIKKDGNHFFYGAGLSTMNSKNKIADSKMSDLKLPVLLGLEATATSWLMLRASVTQDVLLSNSKTETAGVTSPEFNPGLNTTTFAAGAALTFNKVTIDGTLLAGGTQTLNTTNLLGTVGLSYMF